MDQYHNRFPVYDDVSSAGNHFVALAKVADNPNGVAINGSWENNPHSGATAIRNEFLNLTGTNFGGFYFQNGLLPAGTTAPQSNFGDVPNAGINLTGATTLTFWARGDKGGERIEFFVAGVGRNAATGMPTNPFPDSSSRFPSLGTTVTLSASWQEFTIDVSQLNLSYVLGGFAWVANAPNNPVRQAYPSGGATFYLDDIQYNLSPAARDSRLNQPHFLRSYTTEPVQMQPPPVDNFDLALRNSAFTYDNALALLAFLAEGSSDGLRRARLIGDALVYASQHDRSYNDGRLRSDYAAGDISLPPGWTPNGRVGTASIPGFFVEGQGFSEIGQEAVDTGNNAWGMISLLALFRRTNAPGYLATARTLGNFIRTFRNDTGLYQGFQGGLDNPESASPARRPWASTEHNLDVHAAFTTMFQITGEPQWQADAQHASQFVEAMWDSTGNCYLTGTVDPNTRNTASGQLPLDVQAWSTLSLPNALLVHPQVLACAEVNHRNVSDGFSGFDFNEDRDGVWFEGTGHMAVAHALAGHSIQAEGLRQELRRAQLTSPFGNGRGIAAASHDGLSTGFGFAFHRRLHVGATAWNIFAQLEFNPFYQPGFPVNLVVAADAGGGPHVKAFDAQTGAEKFSFFAFDAAFGGGVRVALQDMNGDGFADIIAAAGPGGGPHVRVFNGLTGDPIAGSIGSFYAYNPNFGGGVFVAAGDVNGDGIADVITGADVGGGPHVKAFSGKPSDNGMELASFFAYDAAFTGGVRVAAGNVAGHADGHHDIITGAGPGGGPHVRVFDVQSGIALQLSGPIGSFYAYASNFTGGVYVSAGDINNDGKSDVITGAGRGGGPHVKVFDSVTGTVLRSFFAYAAGFTGGVRVGATGHNGDGFADIITGAGPTGGPHAKVFDGVNTSELASFFAFGPSFSGGIFVAGAQT